MNNNEIESPFTNNDLEHVTVLIKKCTQTGCDCIVHDEFVNLSALLARLRAAEDALVHSYGFVPADQKNLRPHVLWDVWRKTTGAK